MATIGGNGSWPLFLSGAALGYACEERLFQRMFCNRVQTASIFNRQEIVLNIFFEDSRSETKFKTEHFIFGI